MVLEIVNAQLGGLPSRSDGRKGMRP
jgi:hypothetical protein